MLPTTAKATTTTTAIGTTTTTSAPTRLELCLGACIRRAASIATGGWVQLHAPAGGTPVAATAVEAHLTPRRVRERTLRHVARVGVSTPPWVARRVAEVAVAGVAREAELARRRR